jgi:site-specific DNA-methyltransferase (adenine-specific)
VSSLAGHNPDILTCLANLSADEVFTPPKLAAAMLDILPQDLFRRPDTTFLDPVCKSGVFLREIARRLNDGLKDQMPDDQARINHILTKQVYGLAITELTALLSRRSVYCSKKADGKYSIATAFTRPDGNIRLPKAAHTWNASGKCESCGASQGEYERDETFEAYAYPFIHGVDPMEVFNVKFDVIVGNPPYQLDTGGSGRQARPIYQLFIQQAKKLEPRFLTMIVPSRWFAGGMGLDEFRTSMLNDNRTRTLVDYVDARECFPGVDIAGGVCYFLWERDNPGECTVVSRFQDKEHRSTRPLNEFATFVRFEPAVSVLRKVVAMKEPLFTSVVSSTRPFGLKTSDRPSKSGGLRMISSGGEGRLPRDAVTVGEQLIDAWKVMTSKTSHDHAGQPDRDGTRRVLSRLELLEPNAVCTESYIVMGPFSTKREAENCLAYVKTRFVRFLVSLLSFSQDITRERFAYVPLPDMSRAWTDADLAKRYKLTPEEVAFIESKIRAWE